LFQWVTSFATERGCQSYIVRHFGGVIDEVTDHRPLTFVQLDNDRAFGGAYKVGVRAMGIRDQPTSYRWLSTTKYKSKD
jgi:hypothetical protein